MTLETTTGASVKVRRYSGAARINHWITAISFVLLWVSGLALFHPNLYGLSALFGGGDTMRWLHPWIGVVLTISFLGLFLRFFTANLPERTDWKWLGNIRAVLSGHEEGLPEIGKYNAGQKAVFWSMAILIPVMLISGIGLWEAGLAYLGTTFGFKPSIDAQRWAAVVHAAAGVLTIVIWIVHVYAAIWVRGTISAMTEGNVTGGWAWRHHRKWLRKEVAEHKVITNQG